MRVFLCGLWICLGIVSAGSGAEPEAKPPEATQFRSLFDGKTFDGWEGDTENTWRIEEGAIVGGSLTTTVPRNEFLATTNEYGNFELELMYKLVGTEGFVNGGVQFRSQRIPDHHEVIGYQADLGMGTDGSLYDESRRNKQLAIPPKELMEAVLRKGDWNHYLIRAEGPRIQIQLNNVRMVDYVEDDPEIPQTGMIALQIHGACKAIVHFKDIKIRELPVTESVSRFGAPPEPSEVIAPFPEGRFVLDAGNTVVMTGQTDMVRSQTDGTLEAFLATAFAESRPRFRNMAWEGDTVYEQWRDLNFGSWSDQFRAAQADVIFAQFGQMESLDGPEKLEEFKEAYDRLLSQFQMQTKRIVLLSPRPFERPQSVHVPDHTYQNETVRKYVDAVRLLAERHQCVFVNLFAPFEHRPVRLTTNGIHLTPRGQAVAAQEIAKQLRISFQLSAIPEGLKSAIQHKNRVWFDNWRPMNWAFAYGDRVDQPFGKAINEHPSLAGELTKFPPLLAELDRGVQQIALGKEVSLETHAATAPVSLNSDTLDHSVEAELASFTLADGFEVNLFASEEDGLVKPLQIAWDDRGRLWALCCPTYPQIDPGAQPGDYILVCEDTDSDGRADRFTRFAEGLFMPMGIEFGDGGVYLADGTELAHLKDLDGDGRADQREVLLSGFGSADAHQMINGLCWGPGGDLWFGQGHHVYSRVETPWGISRLQMSGVWRYRPQQQRLDGFFNFSSAGLNCQGVARDDYGQIFHNSAAMSGGFYTVPGMIRTPRPRAMKAIAVPERRNTGIEFIGTSHLPDELQGCMVWSGYISNDVHLHQVVEDGSGFKAPALPNLMRSSRREFRPVHVRVGPDGGIYVCDWYNEIIGHYQASYRDPRRDKTHGRIWRVTAKGRPLAKQPDFATLSPHELLNQFKSPERLAHAHARRRLWDLSSEVAATVTDAWLADLDPAMAEYERLLLEACGVYEAHEVVRPELLEQLLNAADPRVRAYGARVVGRWANRLPEPLSLLQRSIQDEHPRVRLEAIVACSEIPVAESIEVAAQGVDFPRDRFIDHALAQTTSALKPYWAPALAEGALPFGGNVERLRWVLQADGARDIAGAVRALVQRDGISEAMRASLLPLLAQVGTSQDLTFVFRMGRNDPDTLQALTDVAIVHGRIPEGDLSTEIAELLQGGDDALTLAAVRLAGAWKLNRLSPTLREMLARTKAEPSLQATILEASGRLEGNAAIELLESHAAPGHPHVVRCAAVAALSGINLNQAATCAARLMTEAASDAEMTLLLTPFLNRRSGTEALANALVATPPDADSAKLAHRVLSAAGRSDEALLRTLNQAIGISAAPVEYDFKFVRALAAESQSNGSAQRGREVFFSKLANCTACHKLDGNGGDLGPDLSIIGVGRSPDLLAESVLWPNRQIREGYMSTKLITDDGQVLVGYKVHETEDELHLKETSVNHVRRIAKESIEEMADAGSIMPAGLTAGLTRAEVVDLIRFLSDLGKPTASGAASQQ